MKNWISSVIFSNPKLTGWVAFLTSLLLTLSFSFVGYQLQLSSEREMVNHKLHEFENLLAGALNDGFSAAKTLGFIAQNQDSVVENFQNIGEQILESNPHVDVLQYLVGGTIVAIYPLRGNEAAIGYNILEDPKTNREAEEAIRREEVYFSGPLSLKQGGTAIVGRYPLFKNKKLVGFSAAIIRFNDLLDFASLDDQSHSEFSIQLCKANPNSGVLENFIPENPEENYTGYRSGVFMEVGNWSLFVQLKNSTALKGLILQSMASLLGSAFFGFLIWNFARQPSLLMKKLKEKSEEILLANERFELAGKATSDVIWDWNLPSDQVYRSDRFFEMMGYTKNQTTANNNFWQSIIHPEDLESVKRQLFETLEGQAQYWRQEFRVRKGDGSYAYIVDKGFIIRDAAGEAVRMIGAFQDISSQKAYELQLVEVNRRLSCANEELKSFASLASHDLREPLRMISSFMSLLDKKYGASLDEKANQYISFALDAAKRLTAMITDLLEYSKVGFDKGLIEEIDTNELLREVLMLKSTLIGESDAELSVEDLPNIRGIKTPIQLLFQNLIGNALKYRNPEIAPQIKISGREMKDFWEFSVADNGIGIEADYLEFIFGLSKRLHSNQRYPGNGMGLATCKKIITQHGGRIWVESTPGIGSIFLFTVRKHD